MTNNIEKEQFINATPERVFRALTEKEELERWFVQKVEIDARPGGAVRFEFAPNAFEIGNILAFEPSRRLSYTWEALSPTPTTLTFALTAQNAGMRVHFTHMGIGEGKAWENYAAAMSHGWTIHLKHLTDWLETGTCETPGTTGSIRNEVA